MKYPCQQKLWENQGNDAGTDQMRGPAAAYQTNVWQGLSWKIEYNIVMILTKILEDRRVL
jgi:hypothetical protein